MAKPVYDTREKLESCEFKHLDRKIGVLVIEPVEHMGWGIPTVEVHWETIVINTGSFGGPSAWNEWIPKTIEATKSVISDLDKVIDELVEHRVRMHVSLDALRLARRTSTIVTGNDLVDKEMRSIISAEEEIASLTSKILEKGNVGV